jgi:hypothetical protein
VSIGQLTWCGLPTLLPPPAAAEQAQPPTSECPEFLGEPVAEDEYTAYGYALACDVEVGAAVTRRSSQPPIPTWGRSR